VATESDLRDLLRGPDPKGRGAIDLDAVLSRARRRRRPRVIAAQALGSVALVGVLGTAVVIGVPQPQSSLMVAEDTAGDSGLATAPEADEGALKADYDVCGEPLVTPPLLGWALDAALGTDAVLSDGSGNLDVTVGLRNDSPLTATGVADIPSLAIVNVDGVVVAQGAPVEPVSTPIELEPDAEFVWTTSIAVASCDPAGTELPAGEYQLRAVVEFLADGLDGTEPVRGTPATIEIQ